MPNETYYSILEVSEMASMAEIKTAYRRLINEVHPDRLANAPVYWQRKAEEKSKEVNEAFGILSNPEKRRLYDAHLGYFRGLEDANRATSSARNSHSPPGNARQQYSQGSTGNQNTSGASYWSASHPPPREQGSQANQAPESPPSGVPVSPSQSTFSRVGPLERLFFSLILALFGFGSALDFWEASSAGEGLGFFVLAGALLFGITWLYQRKVSRLLLATRLSKRRHQLLAVAGAIAIFLVAGKVAYKLPQRAVPPLRNPTAVDPTAGMPPQPLPSSGTGSISTSDVERETPVSLPNGTEILKRRRTGGEGKFTVDNGTPDDAVVELVDAVTRKAIRAFYVESGKKFTESHIGPGTYDIFFMTGSGWDASTRQFSRTDECGAFDQTAEFAEQRNARTEEIYYHEFTVTLHPVVGGTAHTSQLDADAFKKAMFDGELP